MMGYLADEAKTAQVIDENGWLHTGDNGELDKVRVNAYHCVIFEHKNILTAGWILNCPRQEVRQVIIIPQKKVLGHTEQIVCQN